MSWIGNIWRKFWGNDNVKKKSEQVETVVESKVQQEVWAAEKAKAETFAIEAKAKLDIAMEERTRVETFGMKVKVWEEFCLSIDSNFNSKSEGEIAQLKEKMLYQIMGIGTDKKQMELETSKEVPTLKQSNDE